MKLTTPAFDSAEIENLRETLESGWVTSGPMVNRFEASMREVHQTAHALAVTSCTAALHLAIQALDIGPGDEVIVPALSWVTSAHAARYSGAEVRFVDVDPLTYNLDVGQVEAALSSRTKAIIAVHLFGLAADMDAVRDIAHRKGLHVIEDAACAIGTTYRGGAVGTFGEIGCFSFHPRKVITTGEGGMLTTQDVKLAEILGSLRNHGASPNHEDGGMPWGMARFQTVGFNLRLSDIQAAVGVAQMQKLPQLLAHRRKIADMYQQALADMDDIQSPNTARNGDGHSYQSYVIRVKEGGRARRNAIMLHLRDAEIETRPGTHAIHRLDYYRDRYGLRAEDFPVAANSEDTTITIPVFPGMTESDVAYVADMLKVALHESVEN